MSKRLDREMERKQAEIAARPQPVNNEAAQARVKDFHDNALAAILADLDTHKRANGVNGLDHATIKLALVSFANFIGGNKKFVTGADTDALIRLGVEVLSAAAAEAKRRCEEKRIHLV